MKSAACIASAVIRSTRLAPDLAHAPEATPAQIAAILAHKLVHAAVGIKSGHGKTFKRTAL